MVRYEKFNKRTRIRYPRGQDSIGAITCEESLFGHLYFGLLTVEAQLRMWKDPTSDKTQEVEWVYGEKTYIVSKGQALTKSFSSQVSLVRWPILNKLKDLICLGSHLFMNATRKSILTISSHIPRPLTRVIMVS